METQLRPGAEGEEDEVVEGAGASIMEEATAKGVRMHFNCSRYIVCTGKKLVDMINRVSNQHIKFVSSHQGASEHMVTGTALTPDTVSIHFSHSNPGLTGYVLFVWAAVRLSLTM